MSTAKPIFSDCDADLRLRKWANYRGYAGWATHPPRARKKQRSVSVRAHRIVLARMLGRTLTKDDTADHINRNKMDNRRENLRLVTASQNSQNKKVTSPSGHRGVTWHNGAWEAYVGYQRKKIYLGRFSTREAASLVASAKRAQLGFNTDR